MENTQKNTRAWLVFISCVCISAGGIGMFMNCTGIIFTSIIKEFGFRSGDLSLYYTIRSFVVAASVGLMSKLCIKNPKIGIGIMAILGFLNFALMSFYTQLWQWYFSALLGGIAMSCEFVIGPIIINNWFRKNNGMLIGLFMSASGGAGAIFNQIVSKWIRGHGWRFAATSLGLCGALFMIIPTFLFVRVTPEEIGLKPYGYSESMEKAVAKNNSLTNYEVSKKMFFLIAIAVYLGIMMSQFGNQVPSFAVSVGYTIAIGATLSSFTQIGNLLGKTIFGTLSDIIGLFNSAFIMFGVSVRAFLLFLLGQGSVTMLCAACLCLGMSFSLGTTAPPLVFRMVYGSERYKSKMSQYQTVSNVLAAMMSSIIPYIYDFTGTFNYVFMAGILTTTISCLGYIYIKNYVKRRDISI